MPRHLKLIDGIWHHYRRVPKRFGDVDQRSHVKITLETRDLSRALQLNPAIKRAVEHRWLALRKGEAQQAEEAYAGAVELARLDGFQYRPAAEIADGLWDEFMRRLRRLDHLGVMDGQAAAALLGGREQPTLTISEAWLKFLEFTRDVQIRYSKDQLRRWTAPRVKAVNNLISVIGDKAIVTVTRLDALTFQDWWMKRVETGEIMAHTANKDIGHLSQIWRIVSEKLELELREIFKGLRLEEDDDEEGLPIPAAFIREVMLKPGELDGLNEEARDILLVMIETGMRPVEIATLLPRDIILQRPAAWPDGKAFVPFVKVAGGKERRKKKAHAAKGEPQTPEPEAVKRRKLKTPYSKRDMPLVGVALEAMKRHPQGFPRYREKPASLSATVNSYLRENGLLPSEDHTFYGLRHGFQDRITTAHTPERLDKELMGHKLDRPKYGEGFTLEQKRDWLLKIAVTV